MKVQGNTFIVFNLIIATAYMVIALIFTCLWDFDIQVVGIELNAKIVDCEATETVGVETWKYTYEYEYEGSIYTGTTFTDSVFEIGDTYKITIKDNKPSRSYLSKQFYEEGLESNFWHLSVTLFLAYVAVCVYTTYIYKKRTWVIKQKDLIHGILMLWIIMCISVYSACIIKDSLMPFTNDFQNTVATVDSIDVNSSRLIWSDKHVLNITYGIAQGDNDSMLKVSGKCYTNRRYKIGDTVDVFINPDNSYRPTLGKVHTLLSLSYGVMLFVVSLLLAYSRLISMCGLFKDMLVSQDVTHVAAMCEYCVCVLLLVWLISCA